MAIDNAARSRRALLAGAGGAAAALAVQAVGRPLGAQGGTGSVLLGEVNSSADRTTLRNLSDSTTVLALRSSHDGDALRANAARGTAVYGDSVHGQGVYGSSFTSNGVTGYTDSGNGVDGYSTTGSALYGQGGTGFALQTVGRVRFNNISGVAVIPAGATGKTVQLLQINIVPRTFVLLTPRVNIGTRALWYTIDTAADTFRIRISSARTTPTPIAYLVLQHGIVDDSLDEPDTTP